MHRATSALVACLAAAAAALGIPGPAVAAAPGLSDLRVCGAAAFDADDAACGRDQSGRPLRAGRFFCSAQVEPGRPTRFTGRFTYEGKPFPARSKVLPRGSGHAYVDVTTGGRLLPGGRWGCELRLGGERRATSFRSAGPTATLLDARACPSGRTQVVGPVRVCRRDERGRALRAAGGVTCSATLVRVQGQLAQLDVLYDGRPSGLSVARRVPLPVTAFGAQITKAGGLPAGNYACVFSVAGKRLAAVGFRVAA
jgi:hypothetical protein